MFGYEPYKILGALLFTLLLLTMLRVGGNAMLIPEKLVENAYVQLSVTEDYSTDEGEGEEDGEGTAQNESEGKAAAKTSMEGAPQIAVLLAAADAGAGKKLAKKCATCHSFEQGGKNKIGPILWNIVGAEKGKNEGFTYSKALVEKGGTWTYGDLDAFLSAPKAYVTGTKMLFPGFKKPQDRANLILYLHSLSDEPPPLP